MMATITGTPPGNSAVASRSKNGLSIWMYVSPSSSLATPAASNSVPSVTRIGSIRSDDDEHAVEQPDERACDQRGGERHGDRQPVDARRGRSPPPR